MDKVPGVAALPGFRIKAYSRRCFLRRILGRCRVPTKTTQRQGPITPLRTCKGSVMRVLGFEASLKTAMRISARVAFSDFGV